MASVGSIQGEGVDSAFRRRVLDLPPIGPSGPNGPDGNQRNSQKVQSIGIHDEQSNNQNQKNNVTDTRSQLRDSRIEGLAKHHTNADAPPTPQTTTTELHDLHKTTPYNVKTMKENKANDKKEDNQGDLSELSLSSQQDTEGYTDVDSSVAAIDQGQKHYEDLDKILSQLDVNQIRDSGKEEVSKEKQSRFTDGSPRFMSFQKRQEESESHELKFLPEEQVPKLRMAPSRITSRPASMEEVELPPAKPRPTPTFNNSQQKKHITRPPQNNSQAESQMETLSQSVTQTAITERIIIQVGPTGPPGAPGAPGQNGQDGQQGREGQDGPRGFIGSEGPPGRDGERGDKGDRGRPGKTGPTGPRGPPGKDGRQGGQGEEGPRGQNGDRGYQGKTGPTGPPGKDGQQGEEGPRGRVGGEGPQGRDGQQGERGYTGSTGPTGERGPTGCKGDKGDQGDKGDPGDSAIRVYEMVYFDLNGASSGSQQAVSNHTILFMDPGIHRSVLSFNNTGNGHNQVTIDTSLMRMKVTGVMGSVVYHNGLHLVPLNPSVKKKKEGSNMYEILFSLSDGLVGMGTLSLRFT